MQYLISTSKKHYTCAHFLAPDGIHALCTYMQGDKAWPRVGGKVSGGEWIISNAPKSLICSLCENKRRKQDCPPSKPKKINKRLAREAELWQRLTGTEPPLRKNNMET